MNRYSSLPAGFTAVTSGTVLKGDIVKRDSAAFEDAVGIIGRSIDGGQTVGGYSVWRLTDESLLPEFTIKNRWDGSVIFTGKGVSLVAVLLSAYKSGADLRSANLRSANLRSADLSGANLRSADLSDADLSDADLSGADLRSANLSGADLRSADLSGANLRSADLSGANLRSADLSDADLSDADLSGADLRSANLSGADLTKEQKALVVAQRTIVPEEGDLIGFKKVYADYEPRVIKLLIPAAARRLGGVIERKCRAEFAVVLEGEGTSGHDSSFHYKQGETVKPTNGFSDDPFDVCAPGRAVLPQEHPRPRHDARRLPCGEPHAGDAVEEGNEHPLEGASV